LPESDNTPPTYKWEVQVLNNNGDKYEFSTSGQSLQLGKDYQFRVYFTAYDYDGGLKKVNMNGKGLTACPLSMIMDIDSEVCHNNHSLSPDMNGKVQTKVVSLCLFDMKCRKIGGDLYPQALQGPGGTIIIKGFAENYYGGKVFSDLIIHNDVAN